MNISRSKVLAAFGAATAALMVASTAYACTVYRGRAVFAPTLGISHTVVGNNNGAISMAWCDAALNNSANNGLNPPWTATTPRAASVTITTSNDTTDCPVNGNNKLAQSSLYRVGLKYGFMPAGGGSNTVHNCHGSTAQQISTGVVNASGVFSPATVAYTATKAGWHSLCVMDANSADAIATNLMRI